MLKQSPESEFNSLMAATLTYHLPLDCQYSPMDPGVSWLWQWFNLRGRLLEVELDSLGAKHLQRIQATLLKLSSSLETATFKHSLLGKVPSAATPAFSFRWYWAKATMKILHHTFVSQTSRRLYSLDAEKYRCTHWSRLAKLVTQSPVQLWAWVSLSQNPGHALIFALIISSFFTHY